MVDDNSAFVLLPSHMHVRALLAAAAAGDDDSDEAMAAAAADDDDSGMNMLGVPGVSHTLSALRTRSVEPAAATAAPPAPSGSSSGGGVWAGLPSHLAALLPSPVRLSDFRWESYAQYLERRRDVYGHGAWGRRTDGVTSTHAEDDSLPPPLRRVRPRSCRARPACPAGGGGARRCRRRRRFVRFGAQCCRGGARPLRCLLTGRGALPSTHSLTPAAALPGAN